MQADDGGPEPQPAPISPPPIERSTTPMAQGSTHPNGRLPPISSRPEHFTMSSDSFHSSMMMGGANNALGNTLNSSGEFNNNKADPHPFHVSYQVAPPENLPSQPPTAGIAGWGSPGPPSPASKHSKRPSPLSMNRIQPEDDLAQLESLSLAGGKTPGAPYAYDPRLSEIRLEGRPRPGDEGAFSSFAVGPTGAPSPNGASTFCLHVRLLKERMELEVAMRREGLRCLIFVLFCVCLCVALSIASSTERRNASRHVITEALGLGGLEDVVLPSDVYDYINELGHNSRRFFPLSSVYVEDPLAVTLLQARQEFPSGALMVPAHSQPELRLEWTMTAWVGFVTVNPLERPGKALIIRKFLPGDDSGLSCWAWYTKGLDGFVLEYGRHNLDEGYAEVELSFPKQTSPSEQEMRLAALVVNNTHATVRLQSEKDTLEASVALGMGNPTDCPGNEMELGSADLLLADVKFLPYQLSRQDFLEIIEGGATLEDIATGVEDSPAPELQSPEDGASSEQVRAAELQGILTKVVGDLVEGNAASLAEAIDEVKGVPVAAPGRDMTVPGAGTDFASLVGAAPVDLISRDAGLSPLNLTDAFGALASSSGSSFFTLSWWAKAGSDIIGMRELSFRIPGTGNGISNFNRFELYYEENSAFDGVPGWKFQFYNSPFCFGAIAATRGRTYANQCKVSPSWWCEAPAESSFGGTYDGIWRNFALRFFKPSSSATENFALELFLDGTLLCGAVFEGAEALLPQGGPGVGGPSEVLFGASGDAFEAESLPERASFLVKDMRLYDYALSDLEINDIGLDSQMAECVDLATKRDDSRYRTSLGLSCNQISVALNGDDPLAPIACDTETPVRDRCPVSCLPESNPICWDGLPPQHEGVLPEAVPPATAEYTLPRRKMADIYPPLNDPEAGETLMQALEFSDNSTGAWHTILDSVQLLAPYDAMASKDAEPRAEGGIVLQKPEAESAAEMWWRNVSCGVGTPQVCPTWNDEEMEERPVTKKLCDVKSTLCKAEKQLRETLGSLKEQYSDASFADLFWTTVGYQPRFAANLISADSSYTLWYWASAEDVTDDISPSITGVDGSGNICFSILGNQAIIPSRDDSGEDDPIVLRLGDDTTVESNRWAFYALVYDAKDEMYSFAINSDLVEVKVESTDEVTDADGTPTHGCDSLKYLVNTGGSLRISPIRVARRPAQPGSLQNTMVQNQEQYRNTITGPERTEGEMLDLYPRSREAFPMRVYALTPPLALQYRLKDDQSGLQCRSDTAEALTMALRSQRSRQCSSPYSCNATELFIPCPSQGELSTGRFMGRSPLADRPAFAEFLWTLQNPVLVRNGNDFVPASQYVDDMTMHLTFVFIFFTPDTRVATVTSVEFDMSTARMESEFMHQQLKIFTRREKAVYLGWAIAGAVLVFISAVLAVPAATQEIRNAYNYFHGYFCPPTLRRGRSMSQPRYTADTSQPDIFDFILCIGLVLYMVVSIITVIRLDNEAPKSFSELASIDWASETRTFTDKVQEYIKLQTDVVGYANTSATLIDVAFWVLILCAIRVILYLKIHPLIAGVTRTFEVCAWELINFFVSFGIIYVFLAFIAYIKFGNDYDEFATMQAALVSQFSILIGDDAPDYSSSTSLTIYVVGYVFICTLALLNFLLAIVVAGYDNVREAALENQIVTSFLSDAVCVVRDYVFIWPWNKWPAKNSILNTLWRRYPAVFDNTESQVAMGQDEFVDLILAVNRGTSPESAAKLFRHYFRFRFLHTTKQHHQDDGEGAKGVDRED